MQDMDVEETLREIRDRVRVQIRCQVPASSPAQPLEHDNSGANGVSLESLRANLSVIERSRNKLPPVTSYRRGLVSRLELWLKRLIKLGSHWFTWEQVNFNSATSNSLRNVLVVLSSHEEVLTELREQIEKLTSVAREIQLELEARPIDAKSSRGRFHHDLATSDKHGTDSFWDDAKVIDEQRKKVDTEINSLAARLDELRAIKARLEGLS